MFFWFFDRTPISRDRDCYGLTDSEISGGRQRFLACAKDLTILSMAGRYKKLVQYGRESAYKSRALGIHSSLGVYMYVIQHISKEENETIRGA
jgi:hypothetical protein